MNVYHTIAKSVIRKAMQFQRYSESDKELVIKQIGDILQMDVRNIEMIKQNITYAFCTHRDIESPITFRQIESKVYPLVLEVLIYGIFTGITIYKVYKEYSNHSSETYIYVEGDDESTNELCGCGDWDCELCSEQAGLASQLLVGRKD